MQHEFSWMVLFSKTRYYKATHYTSLLVQFYGTSLISSFSDNSFLMTGIDKNAMHKKFDTADVPICHWKMITLLETYEFDRLFTDWVLYHCATSAM
jgi:hypothetical protein